MTKKKTDGEITRTQFLSWVWRGLLILSGALGLAGLARFLAYQAPPAGEAELKLGKVQDYPPGSRTLLKEAQVMMIHDGNGLRALDLLCTHLGCLVEEDETGFRCPCHGSRFAADGSLVQGPAARPLGWLELLQGQDGSLTTIR